MILQFILDSIDQSFTVKHRCSDDHLSLFNIWVINCKSSKMMFIKSLDSEASKATCRLLHRSGLMYSYTTIEKMIHALSTISKFLFRLAAILLQKCLDHTDSSVSVMTAKPRQSEMSVHANMAATEY